MLSWVNTTAAALVLTASLVFAEPVGLSVERAADVPKNVAFMNLGDLLNGSISIEYERALTRWFGVNLGIGMRGFVGPFDTRGEWLTAANTEVGVRFHFLREAPGGLWVGPSVKGAALITAANGREPVRPSTAGGRPSKVFPDRFHASRAGPSKRGAG